MIRYGLACCEKTFLDENNNFSSKACKENHESRFLRISITAPPLISPSPGPPPPTPPLYTSLHSAKSYHMAALFFSIFCSLQFFFNFGFWIYPNSRCTVIDTVRHDMGQTGLIAFPLFHIRAHIFVYMSLCLLASTILVAQPLVLLKSFRISWQEKQNFLRFYVRTGHRVEGGFTVVAVWQVSN